MIDSISSTFIHIQEEIDPPFLLEKLISEVCSFCLEEIKISFTLSNPFVSICKKSLSCIVSELISFEPKSLQYLHAFGVDLTTFLLAQLKRDIEEK